jgi:hypothetical protein
MKPIARTALVLFLALATAGGLAAQEATAAEPAAEPVLDTAATAVEAGIAAEAAPPGAGEIARDSGETRNHFNALLREHPPELGTILALDPTLLSNDAFLAGYPELQGFVAARPEVRRNPRFYLSDFQPRRESGTLDQLLETLVIFATFLLIALALAWVLRTIIEQKRWNRLSRTQSEVHNKILDRFGSSEELLAYVRTPAGARFLESAPIPLHAERATQSPPMARVLWSIQIGVVVAVASLGMLLVSFRLDGETAQGLFVLGAIGFCVGAGFIASAAVSLALSRRLGLWEPPTAAAAHAAYADTESVG